MSYFCTKNQSPFFVIWESWILTNILISQRWEYFLTITNYLDLTICAMFLLFVQLPSPKPIPYVRLKFGICGIFAYYFLMFLWTRGYVYAPLFTSRHNLVAIIRHPGWRYVVHFSCYIVFKSVSQPKLNRIKLPFALILRLSRFGVYITMFLEVLATLLKVFWSQNIRFLFYPN
jgi:hypothetical protein